MQIGQIDLSWNDITELRDNIFAGLISLEFLNLSKNSIVSVSFLVFQYTHVTKIITEHYQVCCLRPSLEVVCSIEPPWPRSCTRLLGKVVIRMSAYLINSLGILMNICSFFIIRQKRLSSGASFNILVAWLSTSDAICCISFLIITINDEIYSSNYLKHQFHLRSNFLCYFPSILSFTTILLSSFTVNFLTLIRYFVVKRPLDPKFHNKKAFNRISILALFLTFILSTALNISYILTAKNNLLPTSLGLVLGHKNAISYIMTTIIIVTQVLSCIMTPVMYFLLQSEMKLAKFPAQQTSHNKRQTSKGIMIAFTSLVCWIPGSVFLSMTLVWQEFPFDLLIWTTLVIMPLNTLIDPSVFVFYKLLETFIKTN